jgi:carbonic anhydrase
MSPSITRRRLIRSGAGLAVAAPVAGPFAAVLTGCGEDEATTTGSTSTAVSTTKGRPQTGDEALDRLLAGNERFVADQEKNEGRDTVRRAELAESQEPFAAILGCADSRVPPEVIFDQGLGDLFSVRIAGNTGVDPFVVGSVEYAVEHLGSILVMVLGHEGCGAVKGAVAVATEGAEEPGAIGDFIAPIVPVVKEVARRDPDLSEGELVEQSVQANVKAAVEELEGNSLLSEAIETDRLKVVGAEYELQTGKVELL